MYSRINESNITVYIRQYMRNIISAKSEKSKIKQYSKNE